MGRRTECLLFAGLLALLWSGSRADEVRKPVGFTETVISKTITFLPQELRTKLGPVEKQIVSAAKPKPQAVTDEPHYLVFKEEGTGPAVLAETFRLVRKGVGEGKSATTLAPELGRLALCVISLSQPYHTDEAAFKGSAHAVFEKRLESLAPSLKVGFTGYRKVDNPSEFAAQIAKTANGELRKLATAADGGQDTASEVPGKVFSLAVNSLASAWWTLLAKHDASDASVDGGQGDYIANKRSLKFHRSTCRSLPAEKNRVYFRTREAAVSEGFVPCKVCKP